MPAVRVFYDNAGAVRALRFDEAAIPTPEPHVMTLKRKIACRGKGAVAAPEDCDFQLASPRASACASSSFNMKCWTLPNAVRGKSSTKTMSRGTLKRASCDLTCVCKSSEATLLPDRVTT